MRIPFLVLAALLILPGCGGFPKPDPYSDKTLTLIAVVPSNLTINIGQTKKFGAIGYDQNNDVMAFYPSWTASGEAGRIDSYSGLFTAVKAGSCEVTASSGSVKGKASVIVTGELPAEIVLITVSPKFITVNVGGFTVFSAIGYDKNGKSVAFAPTWSVFGGVGIIESSGLFTAAASGTGRVIASSGAVQGEATVIVNEL